MTDSLSTWIADADALRHMNQLGVPEIPIWLGYQTHRQDDLYLALAGELFDRMRDGAGQPSDWSRLGNALVHFGASDLKAESKRIGVARAEAALLASAAFYFGGFPASAHLTMKRHIGGFGTEAGKACCDLLARPRDVTSALVAQLRMALVRGDIAAIEGLYCATEETASEALAIGPDEWVSARLLQALVSRFCHANLRAVLPNGESERWTPLVESLIARNTWEFFPSQIDAIHRGFLTSNETASLQMPTGAGKTALCETLLFSHLNKQPHHAAVFLVPYRSLASELRATLVRRMNQMGISTRCAYGGTVPSGDEAMTLDEIQAIVATPEALSGLLTTSPDFVARITLIICDEGHLLDSPGRGIGLELLLARLKARAGASPRFVFLSAIVPNIEDINAWLGGSSQSVIRTDYRPALAEFAVLRPVDGDHKRGIDLEMHAHETEPVRYRIERFLRREDFQERNQATGRINTLPFTSVKARAIACARKALPMGVVAVFAANKGGDQGATGLATELLTQLKHGLSLPEPLSFAHRDHIEEAVEYLDAEYGADWIGTGAVRGGAVLHHGDIPQETREVFEWLLRDGHVAFCICTNTLAEGVNFPIRTLVLYSVQRMGHDGSRENLLTRDIKNLVGRAGRAGATTKGLVICANEAQWSLVEAVARQAPGEPVTGALRKLVEKLSKVLALKSIPLESVTNQLLENTLQLSEFVDGVDATLVELAATEVGEADLCRLALSVSSQTYAAQQVDEATVSVLDRVFTLRAGRISELQQTAWLGWLRETGASVRLVGRVETELIGVRPTWDDIADTLEPTLVEPVLDWALSLPSLQQSIRAAYRTHEDATLDATLDLFKRTVTMWMSGESFANIARHTERTVDEVLRVYSHVISYELQTVIEQSIALLEKILEVQGVELSPAARELPQFLRFGAGTTAGCRLAGCGVRHRGAFVKLGVECGRVTGVDSNRDLLVVVAKEMLVGDADTWRCRLGSLVYQRTVADLNGFKG